MPTSVWLSGFFNPQSFLTAIMQSTARKNELPLDKVQPSTYFHSARLPLSILCYLDVIFVDTSLDVAGVRGH